MLLEKPKNEECGNCYYCVSHMEIETRGGGLFSKVETREHEVFECRRNPPMRLFTSHTGYLGVVEIFTRIPTTSKIHWCGEWRRRE